MTPGPERHPLARLRVSLRTRIIVAILVVTVAPQLLVVAWSQVERTVPGHMWGRVRDAMEAARRRVPPNATPEVRRQSLRAISTEYAVHARIVDGSGTVIVDEDHDRPETPVESLEQFFLPRGVSSVAERDAWLGPVGERPEVAEARRFGVFVGCDFPDPIVCQAAARLGPDPDSPVLHIQQATYRPVAAVYELRGKLARLALVTVPFGIILALVTGRALTKPLDRLRRQVVRATTHAVRTFEHRGRDEVGDLAASLNALVQTLEGERQNREAFVADLVHELKSPIASLRATADALDEEKSDDPRRARLVRVVRDASSRLDTTVSRFLDLARAEAGFPNEVREPIDLAELARDLVGRAAADPRTRDVRFDLETEPATVLGAPHRLDALLAELLENAASFATHGGCVKVVVTRGAEKVTLSVSDDGPGIADADLPHVFDRYYTTRGHARGSGLGLPLVRAVAEGHGGDVDVRSDGGGATFTVRLPAFTRNSSKES